MNLTHIVIHYHWLIRSTPVIGQTCFLHQFVPDFTSLINLNHITVLVSLLHLQFKQCPKPLIM